MRPYHIRIVMSNGLQDFAAICRSDCDRSFRSIDLLWKQMIRFVAEAFLIGIPLLTESVH
jgi:hypothetical protein